MIWLLKWESDYSLKQIEVETNRSSVQWLFEIISSHRSIYHCIGWQLGLLYLLFVDVIVRAWFTTTCDDTPKYTSQLNNYKCSQITSLVGVANTLPRALYITNPTQATLKSLTKTTIYFTWDGAKTLVHQKNTGKQTTTFRPQLVLFSEWISFWTHQRCSFPPRLPYDFPPPMVT